MVYEPSLKLKHMNLLALELPVGLSWNPSGPLRGVEKVFWVAETAAKDLLKLRADQVLNFMPV
jgi:hypothetical protein